MVQNSNRITISTAWSECQSAPGCKLELYLSSFKFEIMKRFASPKFDLKKHQKSNLYYTRGISLKRVTTGGDHLSGLASGQTQLRRNIAAVARRLRHCARFGRLVNRTQTSRADSDVDVEFFILNYSDISIEFWLILNLINFL